MKKIIIFMVISTLMFFYVTCKGKTEKTGKDTVQIDQQQMVEKSDTEKEEPIEEKVDTTRDTPPELEEETQEKERKTEPTAKPAATETQRPGPGPGEEGIITLSEGDVDIIRNNESLGDEVEEGFGIQNYDVVSTGEESMAEIEVLSETCPETLITISENTIFSFEINKLENTNTTSFDLMGGAFTLKVGAMTNDQDMEVTTGEVNMGVRGTTFSVSTLPTGDTLITCKKGLVECTDDSGEKKRAKPGKVVERSGGAGIKEISVDVARVDKYSEEWYDEKVRLLKNDALTQIKKYAGEYEKRIDQFNEAYTGLMNEQDIIAKWKEEDRKGKKGSTMEIMKEKKKIIGHIYKIQGILFWFQHVYYRLAQLKKYHDSGFGRGEIRPGYTTIEFFKDFSKADIEIKLLSLRYIFKLYAKRNDGSVPVGSTSGSLTDDFFGNDDF